jgi:hypothetical protein
LLARVPGIACKAIVVHLPGWGAAQRGAVRSFAADRPIDMTIALPAGEN